MCHELKHLSSVSQSENRRVSGTNTNDDLLPHSTLNGWKWEECFPCCFSPSLHCILALSSTSLFTSHFSLKSSNHIFSASGGFISFSGSWRVQGILAMSRSLGDYPLKNLNVVIPDPDIMSFDLNKLQPEFMILASDGLWDTFSNEEAVRFIRERLAEPHFGAKSIVLQSFYRGCPDNITVMVVKFKGKVNE